MKTIQKIATMLTLLIMATQLYCSNTRSHSRTSGSHSGAKGAAVGSTHSHNQQPQAAGVAAAGIASKNSQDSGSGSSQSSQPQSTSPSSSSPVASPTANPMSSAAAAPTMNAAPSTDSNQAATQAPATTPTNTPTPVDQPKPADQSNAVNATETVEQKQATEDQKTIAPDQDEILQQLKTIDLEDSKTHSLFSMAAMDQLFNNFVYFKDFIVKNFAKDKMMGLAIEFINQIYPKEHVAVLTMTSTKPNTEIKNETVEPVEQVENNNEAMPTEDEYAMQAGDDVEQPADNYADNYYEDSSAASDDSSHLQEEEYHNDNQADINPEDQQYYQEQDMSMAEPSEQSTDDNQVEN